MRILPGIPCGLRLPGKEDTELSKRKNGSVIGRFFGRLLLTLVLVGVLCGCFCGIAFAFYVHTSINPSAKETASEISKGLGLNLNSFIYTTDAETGEEAVYETIKGRENREWVDSDKIPDNLKNAVVSIEDERFYKHHGVDWWRTLGAVKGWVLGGDQYGGSTITQQLIKNVTTEDDVTVQRKLVEIFRALDLEKEYTKEEIMEWYLNVVYFGEGASGVQMAANTYFGKDVRDLTLAQCASIIGITNNPSRYSPFASVENNKKRTKTILYEMYDQDYISHEEYTAAVAEVDNDELHFIRGENEVYQQEIYSYYVEMVIKDVLSDLQSRLGLSEAAARQLLYHGGYQIYACVDPFVQQVVDDIYTDPDSMPQPYYYSSQPLQSACMVIDPFTGEIKAIGGAIGEKDRNFGFNYAIDAHRPSGSSAKPLASYGPAMDLGLITESTLVDDSPDIQLRGTYWYPRNSGSSYDGIITIWDALVRSKNTVAAQIIDKLTPSVSFEYLTERMGFQLVEADRDYAPLALGQFTYGVTVREMAQAYTSFPNDGEMTYARSYSLITDSNGNTVLENGMRTSHVFSVDTARCMTEMLEAAAWYGTGYEVYLGYGKMPVAGKTGTTSDDYDRWFCGFSPYYVTAVWTGYDSPAPMYYSGNPAAQIWRRIMSQINEPLPVIQFNDPTNRGYDTGIFGDLETTPEPTPVPTATPAPTEAPTPEPTVEPTPAPTDEPQRIPLAPSAPEE